MKRIIIALSAFSLSLGLAACDEPMDEEELMLREAELDEDADGVVGEGMEEEESVDEASRPCPNPGSNVSGHPDFADGLVEYWSFDPGECNGRLTIRKFCPSSGGGNMFNNACGCGCVWNDSGMQ
jgi:hypothetical protein